MITRLNRSWLPALVLLFAGANWNLLAEPNGNPKGGSNSSSAVSTNVDTELSGEELWSNNCLRCHNLRPATMYNNAQWDVIVHHMRLRANITGKEQRAIVEFLKSSK
jgi:hypothetical protein